MESTAYKAGAEYITNSDKWDTTLAELIQEQMDEDGDAAKYINTLAYKYINASPEKRDSIDWVMIHLCGWGMDTLLSKLGQQMREVA